MKYGEWTRCWLCGIIDRTGAIGDVTNGKHKKTKQQIMMKEITESFGDFFLF